MEQEFYDAILALLARHFLSGEYRVLDRGSYGGGMALDVTVELPAFLLRCSYDRGDCWIEVASHHRPNQWFHVPNLMLLVSGDPVRRDAVLVGKSLDDLEQPLAAVARHTAEIARLLSDEEISKTEQQIRAIKQATLSPAVAKLIR